MVSGFPEWLRWYKKPSYVDVTQFAKRINERFANAPGTGTPVQPESSERRRRSAEIPSKLRLEKILKNRTCSPMSLYDFYMYLKYIELSAENLEFYIWFKNYKAGRLTAFPEFPQPIIPLDVDTHVLGSNGSETDLTVTGKDETRQRVVTWPPAQSNDPGGEGQENLTFEESDIYARIASLVRPGISSGPCMNRRRSPTDKDPFAGDQNTEEKTSIEIGDIRRTEIDTIKSLFLLPGSPKELNIPSTMRRKVLDAIATSTEAEHLAPVAEHCYLLLRSCSHRNFVRLGVSNGTFETICMATGLGIVLTICGFLTVVLLALVAPSFRHCSRWRALGVWPLWSIGGGLVLSGLRGSCFFLLLFSRRQPMPWERFADDPAETRQSMFSQTLSKIMIFDRKLKVKDDNLRRLQRKVVYQSLLGGMLFATLMLGVVIVLPIWEKI
ncbi:hypothetical protein MBM_01917 [Drepanopeziza brunnea f. sp. 'multigermtubi' MB_m1]|uniref:RGS domain-containing protein n=2 Tax=Drepanopeziza brunnea f. sp. 'multigermtubi' TaxID=698441 RepID=K1WQP1_MARBU|nr:uncharacterized protein MBM_01917 [Drepanopeziza brunnea f. sp. 'multigermtubi' MB_m1]EKD19965.1 hypothetical protein MBM_01917 [Drepanopeziza brunnea f. sp. 'multigermtubi' MB_m1]